MLIKAALMKDEQSFKKICDAKSPPQAKALGRKVAPFNESLWLEHLEETAATVVFQKFDSDDRLRNLLLGTGDKHLAEMTDNDSIWGTGVALGTPEASDPSKWPGKNHLGKALMKARTMLRERETRSSDA